MIYSCKSHSVDLSKITCVSPVHENQFHRYYYVYILHKEEPIKIFTAFIDFPIVEERDNLVKAWQSFNEQKYKDK